MSNTPTAVAFGFATNLIVYNPFAFILQTSGIKYSTVIKMSPFEPSSFWVAKATLFIKMSNYRPLSLP